MPKKSLHDIQELKKNCMRVLGHCEYFNKRECKRGIFKKGNRK